jgi:hypothetical protein
LRFAQLILVMALALQMEKNGMKPLPTNAGSPMLDVSFVEAAWDLDY